MSMFCGYVRYEKFIDAHKDLRNSLGPDETVDYVDAVHPTHQAKPLDAGCRADSAARFPRRPGATG